MENQFKKGDMMSVFGEVDHFIVCVGSNLHSQTKELIMLNGVAGALAQKFPVLPGKMGAWVLENVGDCGVFFFYMGGKVGILQHMIVPRNGVNLGLVSNGCKLLAEHAKANPTKRYALEAPNYREPMWLVEGSLRMLPENVEIWVP